MVPEDEPMLPEPQHEADIGEEEGHDVKAGAEHSPLRFRVLERSLLLLLMLSHELIWLIYSV